MKICSKFEIGDKAFLKLEDGNIGECVDIIGVSYTKIRNKNNKIDHIEKYYYQKNSEDSEELLKEVFKDNLIDMKTAKQIIQTKHQEELSIFNENIETIKKVSNFR